MKTKVAITLGKSIHFVTRTLKIGGGSAAPGLYALKVDPNLVKKLAKNIPTNIVITGTNGKTTTARMIAHLLKDSNLKIIRNQTGSNLERGIASALITHSGKTDLGIWELDEAAFNSVAPKLKPNVVIFLNVFRDQLDRYGEVDSVIKRWQETLKKLPKNTQVLVNGDDASLVSLKDSFRGNVEFFSLEKFKIAGEKKAVKVKPTFEAKNIKLSGLKGSRFTLTINHTPLTITLPLPGTYNIYNAVAALAVVADLPLTINQKPFADFSSAFGRVEKLPFGYIFLIKNPTGATQVFQTIASQIKPKDRLLLALNDNLADGTDVSWIWDADFEILPTKTPVVVSGSRADDLAVRLKYAGYQPKNIKVIRSLEKALQEARKGLKGTLFVLPTYTAMLQLQALLAKMGLKRDYWRES